MKRLVLSALAAVALAACSTPTVYQPAAGPRAVGYSEYRIEPDRYRVTFRSGNGAAPEQVMDLALMRAAELTLANGYDWFRVAERAMRGVGGYGGPDLSLGFGGMSFGRHTATGVGVGTGFDLSGGPQIQADLEILMGRGPKPPGLDVYDAHAVRSTLGRPGPG